MAARFEYASLAWSTMEGITTEEQWNRWADFKYWEWLPPHQDMRHRCDDEVLYLGEYSAHKYQMVKHANMELKPAWRLWLGENMMCLCQITFQVCQPWFPSESYNSKLVPGALKNFNDFERRGR